MDDADAGQGAIRETRVARMVDARKRDDEDSRAAEREIKRTTEKSMEAREGVNTALARFAGRKAGQSGPAIGPGGGRLGLCRKQTTL